MTRTRHESNVGPRWRAIGATAALAAVAGAGVLAYTVRAVQGRARGDVEDFLARPASGVRPIVVAGASIVRGRASVDFVDLLRHRFPERVFVNAGVNGNVAWELGQRLDAILACSPEATVLLIGTNDVQATLSEAASRSTRDSKSLPALPSRGWYADCLSDVVRRLQVAGSAVAICSLPPIGQDLSDAVNARVGEFNESLAEVCAETGAELLPVGEAMTAYLRSHHAAEGPPWTGSWGPGLASLVRHFILGHSYDRVARSHGWLLSPDGVHLNGAGATITADAVGAWLQTMWGPAASSLR